VYLAAAKALLDEGKIAKDEVPWDSDGYRPPTAEFIDGVEYDGRKPVEYIAKLKVGRKDTDAAPSLKSKTVASKKDSP